MSSLTIWATWADERNWGDCLEIGLPCVVGVLGVREPDEIFLRAGGNFVLFFTCLTTVKRDFEPVRRIIDEQDGTNPAAYEFG